MCQKHSKTLKFIVFCMENTVDNSYDNTEKVKMKEIDAVSISAAAKWQQGNEKQVVKSFRSSLHRQSYK